jgi:hypothetical protein
MDLRAVLQLAEEQDAPAMREKHWRAWRALEGQPAFGELPGCEPELLG